MAKRNRRKRKQGGVGGDLAIKLFATLLIVLVMIGSFLLFAVWLYFERKKTKLPKARSIHDFDNTHEEINHINQQARSLERIYSRLDKIELEGQSLTKRQDGLYNERGKKGKQLNSEINNLSPRADNLEQSIYDLESLPEKRLNNWIFYVSMCLASRQSVLSYIASFALFVWLQPKWVIQLSETLKNLSLLDFYASYPIAYGASVGSLVISLIVMGLSFFYWKSEKKDSLTNAQITEPQNNAETDDLTVSDFIESLSNLPHSHLKRLADEFDIQADRRSKATILEAISNEDSDTISNIYARLAEQN